jgi:type I restriction enzyme S subunit
MTRNTWEHETRPLWTILEARDEFGQQDLPLLTVISDHGVRYRNLADGRTPSEDLSEYRVVHPGDLVVNKMWARFGAYGVAEQRGIISPAYWVLKPDADVVEPRFLHHVLRSPPYRAEIWRRSKDLPPNGFDLPWQQFRTIPVPLPPIKAQRAFADHLDRETERIDALIAAKRRMAELLQERWSATVTHLTSPAWAREMILEGRARTVPDGWSIRKLGSLTRPGVSIAYGILLPGERLEAGVAYIGAGDVRPDRLRLELLPRTRPEIAAAYPRTVMRAGELVYAIRGSFGAVEQIPSGMDGVNLSRDAARISPATGVEARWLMYALKSELAQEQFRRREVGATITGVNIEDLKSVRLPLPQPGEQAREARYLDGARARFNALNSALDRQIGLLTEHRNAIITAAVNEQITVPDAA